MSDSNSDPDSEATAENPTDSTDQSDGGNGNGAVPEISARLYEMEVTVSGGDGDTLTDVGTRFEETWSRVLETYREEREADDTRPFQ